jgi:hypothetical protein
MYGDGNQGSATFDGTSTILGLAPASTVYSMVANIQGDTITVNASTTLKPLGFVLLCATRLNNAGTIHSNGNDAVTSTGGLIIAATGSLAVSAGNGGDGRSTTGAGSPGAGSGGRNVGGGVGGAGGSAGGANTGGAGNSSAAPTAVQGTMRHLSNMLKGKLWDATAMLGSGGGGGGGVDTAGGAGTSGGGGSGAIGMLIFCKELNNTGTISCNGGAGAAGSGNKAGGGGGGGGGWLTIITERIVSLGTITVSGGTIGAAGGSASAAVAGTAGLGLIFTPTGTTIITT